MLLILLLLVAAICLAACGETPIEPVEPAGDPGISEPSLSGAAATIDGWRKSYTAGRFGIRKESDPFVELKIAGYGSIRLELYPDVAPISVANFTQYVREGFYDGMVFHRVIRGFMIQTGGFGAQQDANGNIWGVQKVATHADIKGEFSANGVKNELSHAMGVISMARFGAQYDDRGTLIATNYDTASSQFFICSADRPDLDGNYATFGRVIDEESMAVVSAIEQVRTTTTYLVYSNGYGYLSEDVPEVFPRITEATLVQIGE